MTPQKFRVTWRVNGEVTYILENVTAEMAYEEAVPDEALRPEPGNRWHVLMRRPALTRMLFMAEGDEFAVAYQDPPSRYAGRENPLGYAERDPSAVGADQEEIRIARIV